MVVLFIFIFLFTLNFEKGKTCLNVVYLFIKHHYLNEEGGTKGASCHLM